MEALNQLNAILTGLGVNSTVWIQLGLFLFTFVLLNNVVFKSYQKAFQERHDKTLGGEDLTKQLVLEAQEIQSRYEKRARQVNEQIKTAYDAALGEAYKKQNDNMENTRKEAAEALKQARVKITSQVRDARGQLQADLPAISALVASKLMGKETT
ncbi:MAG: ATP synthase F0 subunit B [Bdellovibrionia bacterium]